MADQNQETNSEQKPAESGATDAEANLDSAIRDMDKMSKDHTYEPKKGESTETKTEEKKVEPKKEEKKTENKSPDGLDLDALGADKGMMSKKDKSEEEKYSYRRREGCTGS